MGFVVVESDLDDLADGFNRFGILDAHLAVDRTDLRIRLLEDSPVEPFLAFEVVVDHSLGRARALGNRIDTSAAQAKGGELFGRHRQDVGF